MSAVMITTGALLFIASGLLALLLTHAPVATHVVPTVVHITGAIVGLGGCVAAFMNGGPSVLAFPWQVPGGAAIVNVDVFSAFFATPVFLIAGSGALYADRSWPFATPRGVYVRCFFGLLTGALALVMVAGHTLFFVALWEIVALASFFLVATDDADAASRSAAWLYLASSHVAILALFAVVTLLHSLTGTWTFTALPAGAAMTAPGHALFWLALVAFGIKAGVMPFHVWLPGAHAAAPAHVSAIMSGVVLKMGIYGFVRVLSLYSTTPAWMGGTVLAFGIVSSILGVAFALAQHDLKRLLAYHSIENIGIIFIGIGTGLVARAHGAPVIAALGFAGALLHVWNHGLFKALLFFGAGAAVHGSHTREIDRMGGLARRMPGVALSFLIGAVAICGLPPLNGFVSEWFLYISSFKASFMAAGQSHGGWSWLLLLVAPALALTGALALACFAKAFGAVFLGNARTAAAAEAPNPAASTRAALVPLVVACVVIGVLPGVIAPLLERVVAAAGIVSGISLTETVAPLQRIAIGLFVALIAAAFAIRLRLRHAPRVLTWDCGYAAPTARMQYTASSTARTLVGFFAWAMPANIHAPGHLPLFPTHAELATHVPDTVLDRALLPGLRLVRRMLSIARYIQSGRVQLYLLYVGVALLALLVWSFQ